MQKDAQFDLGVLYAKGIGVPQDDGEAEKWYLKAAVQGHVGAQFNFGLMYYNGEGVPRDHEETAKWWRKAAEQGLADTPPVSVNIEVWPDISKYGFRYFSDMLFLAFCCVQKGLL